VRITLGEELGGAEVAEGLMRTGDVVEGFEAAEGRGEAGDAGWGVGPSWEG
jgi:hypothetical protein